jgi:hypothetical protein
MREGKNVFRIIISLLGWFALVVQFYIMYGKGEISKQPLSETVINYFSYFTILTNILVAFNLTIVLLKPLSRLGNFFSKAATATAIAVYITVVGLIYNTLLRHLWAPAGWQLAVDELLHLVIPVLYILYWIFFIPRVDLKWKSVLSWLIYPLLYLIYILIYGAYTHWYPYPFVDADMLGYAKTFINVSMLFVLFVFMSLLFITADRMLRKKNYQENS